MISDRSLLGAVLGGLTLGALLVTGCASAKSADPPAASPQNATPVPAPQAQPIAIQPAAASVGRDGALEYRRRANARDWLSPIEDAAPTKSLKSLDGPAPPFIFAERRASEALDHLSSVVTIRREKRGNVITLSCDKLVEPGQWALTVSGQYALKELAPGLRDQEGHAILIQAYTDSMGTSAVNDALSLRRAEAVRDFLATQGVGAEGMRAEGLGAKRPVTSNSTPDGRAQNRRIEIVIAP
jgi:outer membrane protein OmpA-like peptidoglycan-associated protein